MASLVAMPVVFRGVQTGRGPMEITKKELPLARSMCWHCQSDIGGEYFCNQCVKVQPLSKDMDYFSCFGLPRKLNIDTARLETKFYELSRVFHPDFFEGKSEMERAVSLANSAILNQAYRTLKDPIQRVEYLLRLEAGLPRTSLARHRPISSRRFSSCRRTSKSSMRPRLRTMPRPWHARRNSCEAPGRPWRPNGPPWKTAWPSSSRSGTSWSRNKRTTRHSPPPRSGP